jgi:hypothetical protein
MIFNPFLFGGGEYHFVLPLKSSVVLTQKRVGGLTKLLTL